jgi:hypothetical protein
MRLSHSSILVVSSVICLGFYLNPASKATAEQAANSFKTAQVNPVAIDNQTILRVGDTGASVEALQTQLKQLGYYKGVVDGKYGTATRLAVSQFQQANGVIVDGIVGSTTWKALQAQTTSKEKSFITPVSNSLTSEPTREPELEQKRGVIWWLLVGLGVLGSIGAVVFLMQKFGSAKKDSAPKIANTETHKNGSSPVFDSTTEPQTHKPALINSQNVTASSSSELLPPETTSRLAKVNIVDELIQDLRSPDPTKRRKAIWDLGQLGDSRAIQPLVDIMIDADSQQRSLILAALAEIGSRTLKPMNRALAISLQDESPQVRQNAIRDLTRVYDLMAQMSQMLSHAVEDPDEEVQTTARYALSQMNRIRALSALETKEETELEEEEEENK